MKHSFVAILSASILLSACGGGGSSPASAPSPATLSPATNTVIIDALKPIADKNAPKPFTGAFMLVEGVGIGYVSATSRKAAVELVAGNVVADPVKYASYYKLLLSDGGLSVDVVGESVGTSSVSGLPLYAGNIKFMVKLLAGGAVVIVQQ